MTDKELKALFARYMKTPDGSKAHATLSASGSERWLGCPASVSLSKGRLSLDSPDSIIGTNAHTLFQFILENPGWKLFFTSPMANDFKKAICHTKEQLESVLVAVSAVRIFDDQMKRRAGNMPEMYTERKVHLKGVGFGTADVILFNPFGILHVMDYKNGKYKVEPEDNTQGLYYAVAAADEFGWDFKECWITILQPNAPHKLGPIRTWKTTPERLEKAKVMFTRGALATKKKDAPCVPNHKYCWYCPARPVCPAQMAEKEKNIMSKFNRG